MGPARFFARRFLNASLATPGNSMPEFWRHARFAWRILAPHPAFSLVVVFSIVKRESIPTSRMLIHLKFPNPSRDGDFRYFSCDYLLLLSSEPLPLMLNCAFAI